MNLAPQVFIPNFSSPPWRRDAIARRLGHKMSLECPMRRSRRPMRPDQNPRRAKLAPKPTLCACRRPILVRRAIQSGHPGRRDSRGGRLRDFSCPNFPVLTCWRQGSSGGKSGAVEATECSTRKIDLIKSLESEMMEENGLLTKRGATRPHLQRDDARTNKNRNTSRFENKITNRLTQQVPAEGCT